VNRAALSWIFPVNVRCPAVGCLRRVSASHTLWCNGAGRAETSKEVPHDGHKHQQTDDQRGAGTSKEPRAGANSAQSRPEEAHDEAAGSSEAVLVAFARKPLIPWNSAWTGWPADKLLL